MPPQNDFLISPDFTLATFEGQEISLSDFRNRKHVILVFNRGFT